MTQTDEERQGAKDVMGRLDTLTLPQLQALNSQGPSALPPITPTAMATATPATASTAVAPATETTRTQPTAENTGGGIKQLLDSLGIGGARNTGLGVGGSRTPGLGLKAPEPFVAPRGKSMTAITQELVGGGEGADGYLERAAARDKAMEEGITEQNKKVTGKAFDDYKKALEDEAKDFGAGKEEAKNMALLKAGLAMMAGTSRHGLENIGKGAAPALKGYGEDVRGLRSEERGRVKELLGIEGMRQDAKRSAQDVELKKQMIDVQRMAAGKPSSTQEIIALGKSSGLSDREIMGMLSGAAKDPDISARNIAMKAFYESPVLQAQYKNDINAFLKAQGIGAGAGGQAPLNYVPGKGVV
jgi:hypothetical protein